MVAIIIFTDQKGRTDYEHLHVRGLDDPLLMQRVDVLTNSGREVDCIDSVPEPQNDHERDANGHYLQ